MAVFLKLMFCQYLCAETLSICVGKRETELIILTQLDGETGNLSSNVTEEFLKVEMR